MKVTMKFEVLKTHFKAYIIHSHGPSGFAMGEAKNCSSRKRQGSMTEKCCYTTILHNNNKNGGGREDEDKEDMRMNKLDSSSKLPFLVIYSKKSAHSLYGAWSILFVHISLHLVRGPKAL